MRRSFAAMGWLVVLSTSSLLIAPAQSREPEPRWVAATPDEMVALSQKAALRDGPDALARLLIIGELVDSASAGVSRSALDAVALAGTSLAADARWLARQLEPDAPVRWTGMAALPFDEGAGAPRWPGLARSWALLGPFEDNGGGLARAEGPEVAGHRFAGADYSWGVYAVRTQRALVSSVTPRGVPLDLYIVPRNESCTYLSTVVTAPEQAFELHIASSGAFRAQWDGRDFAQSEEVHAGANLDRASVTIDTSAGDHLLTLKVCSGASDDAGRVRVRFSRDQRDLPLATSSAIARLDAALASAARHASTISARPTALSRARADGSLDDALSTATVRTIAGADDLRALSAPGQLDRVASDPAISADRLALAGFIAGFGSNQSGWLARAIERARARSDAQTESFAQRALVSYRLGTGAVDLAHATAGAPPLKDDGDDHARWLRARVDASLGGAGLSARALSALRALAQARGARTPFGVWNDLARWSSADPSAQLAALQHLANGLPERRDARYLSAYRMMGASSLERLAMNELLTQTDVNAIVNIGQLLNEAGRYPAAKQALALAASLAPNHGPAHSLLSRALRAMSPSSPQGAAVVDELLRAAELNPQNAELSAELRFRTGEKIGDVEAGPDAAYIVAPSVFLARGKDKPIAAGGVFERQLHWRRVVRLHGDKRVSQLMHYAREIGVAPRTEGERYENLPGAYGTELLIARVHRPDGTVLAPEEQDSAGPSVRWPKLERGDVVEVAVRTWTPGPVGRRGDAPFYFLDYVGAVDSQPVLYNEVIIDVPERSPLAFDVIGGAPDRREVRTEGNRVITQLIWDAPPSIPDEPLAPRMSELMPMVVGSVYPTWDAFLDWYRGAVEGFTTPDDQIRRIAAELTEGKRTREEKVQALFNFVADDIRYVNFVSGEWWLPNRPQHLLARRQGDCDDKAMLLIALLRSVGIEASEVLVQTRHTAQRRVMQSDRVVIPMFDHGIIYLPNEDGVGGRYLDATSPQSRIGSLPAMDAGALVLNMGDAARVQLAPAARADEHGVTARWTLQLASDGSGTLIADETHMGDQAFRLRTHLREQDARAQWVEGNLIGGWFSGLEMHPEVTFDGELPGGQARVGFRATSRSLARREGTDLIVAVAPSTPVAMQLAPLRKRTLPVELPPQVAPQYRRMIVEMIAPSSHQFTALPPDALEDGGTFGKASLTLTRSSDGRKVTMTREVALAQSLISVAEYPAWRAWLQRIDALLLRSVRLERR